MPLCEPEGIFENRLVAGAEIKHELLADDELKICLRENKIALVSIPNIDTQLVVDTNEPIRETPLHVIEVCDAVFVLLKLYQ